MGLRSFSITIWVWEAAISSNHASPQIIDSVALHSCLDIHSSFLSLLQSFIFIFMPNTANINKRAFLMHWIPSATSTQVIVLGFTRETKPIGVSLSLMSLSMYLYLTCIYL